MKIGMAGPNVQASPKIQPKGRPGPVRLALLGLPSALDRDLEAGIEQRAPGRFIFFRAGGNLFHTSADKLVDSTIVAGTEGIPVGTSLESVVRRLREELYLWGAIHLFVRRIPEHYRELTRTWSVYMHDQDLYELNRLIEELEEDRGVEAESRRRIVGASVEVLADELASLRRALDPHRALQPSRVRNALLELVPKLSGADSTLRPLALEARRALASAVISQDDISELLRYVVTAEAHARSNDGLIALRSALHALKNALSLAEWEPESPSQLAAELLPKLYNLSVRGSDALRDSEATEIRAAITPLLPVLRAVRDGQPLSGAQRELTSSISGLRRLALDPVLELRGDVVPIRRLLVVEDDPDWRKEIVDLLLSLSLELPVQEASSIAEAEFLLERSAANLDIAKQTVDDPASTDLAKQLGVTPQRACQLAEYRLLHSGPALVLIDLGLPERATAEVQLDAGLSLIRKYSKSGRHSKPYQYRFAVLTAAGHYTEALREAMVAGVSPHTYLKKDSSSWQREIRRIVRLSLQEPPPPYPHVEIYRQIDTAVWIDGNQVPVERSQWCILACFAENRYWQASRLVQRLALPPYQLELEDEPEDDLQRLHRHMSHLRDDLVILCRQIYHRNPPELLVKDELGQWRSNVPVRLHEGWPGTRKPQRKPSVLVVEDNEGWQGEIRVTLQEAGFAVQCVSHVAEATEALAGALPDLLVLDLELPLDAVELEAKVTDTSRAAMLLDQIRRDVPGLPVVVFTAVADRDTEMLAMLRQGVRLDDYISKGDSDWQVRLSNSLLRLWHESLTHARILGWEHNHMPHSIGFDPASGLLCSVGGYPVRVKPTTGPGVVLKELSATPNIPVSKERLKEALWPDPDRLPPDADNALKLTVSRLRSQIAQATHGEVPGEEVIPHGMYCLVGVVHWEE